MYEQEEEWDHGSEYVVTECERCGIRKPCQFLPDPFLDEIYNEIEKSWWCRPCWIGRKEDI